MKIIFCVTAADSHDFFRPLNEILPYKMLFHALNFNGSRAANIFNIRDAIRLTRANSLHLDKTFY